MRRNLSNLALFLGSIAIFLTATEAGLRFISSPEGAQRVLFFSAPIWTENADGTTTYPPSSDIRTVAVYGDKVEYDVWFHVNNRGYPDTLDYPERIVSTEDDRALIIMGDSFVAAHHAPVSWTRMVRDALGNDKRVYFLGVPAAGAFDFLDTAAVRASRTGPHEIVVVAISHDFFRPHLKAVTYTDIVPVSATGTPAETCLLSPTCQVRTFRADQTHEKMIEIAGYVYERTPTDFRSFIGNLEIYKRLIRPLRERLRAPLMAPKVFFRRLRALLPNARIVWLRFPEKREVQNSGYYLDFDGTALSQSRIEVFDALVNCDFGSGDYHESDSHPNQKGYDKVARCFLDNLVTR